VCSYVCGGRQRTEEWEATVTSLAPEVWYGVAIVLGLLVIRALFGWRDNWLNTENKVNSPLSITLKTGETPADVNRKAESARGKRWFLDFCVFVFLCYGFYLWNRELATELFQAVLEVVMQLMRMLITLLEMAVEQLGKVVNG